MNAVIGGEHNWISNLLGKNNNAAPWIIRPVRLKYNIRSLQWSSTRVKSRVWWGWKNRGGREKKQNMGTDWEPWEKRAVFMFSERTRKLVIMEWSYPGRAPLPRLSDASLERMINVSTLHYFPLSKSNTNVLQHRPGHSPNQKSNVDKNKK